jgi:isopropylmalate/homocitrate/citramalate synthase
MNKLTNKWNFINFIKWANKKDSRLQTFLSMGSPFPFDVSLRDGIQSIPINQQIDFTLNKKQEIFSNIMCQYLPKNMEIGSIVSPSVLPIMKDTPEIFRYASNESKKYFRSPNLYVLVPNMKNLENALQIKGLDNFSFITSASDDFQMKNTKKNLFENKKEIFDMLRVLDNSHLANAYNVKLYMSCINECPISGKIDNVKVSEQIMNYHHSGVNKICLSDTCGSLDAYDFSEIMNRVHYYGMPTTQFSLHLHVNPNKIDNVKKIMFHAFDRGITDFDVSDLSTGGCSVTMKNENICPNLSYDLYFDILTEYIESKGK